MTKKELWSFSGSTILHIKLVEYKYVILTLLRDQCSFVDTGHIYWYILMKCCMVACINILYPENRLSAASAVGAGGRVGGFVFFTRFRPFGVDWQKKIFTEKFDYRNFRDDVIHREIFLSSRSKNFQWKKKFCKSTPNGLKRVKNTKPPTRPPPPPSTADAAADRFPQ